MNSSFHSALAPDIESFIKMKRSLGYKYHNEEYILHRFDTYQAHLLWILQRFRQI